MERVQLDSLLDGIAALLPRTSGTTAADLRKNLRAMVSGWLAGMDLVTREEFDVQTAVLARTRARIEELEQQLRRLEEAMARPDSSAKN